MGTGHPRSLRCWPPFVVQIEHCAPGSKRVRPNNGRDSMLVAKSGSASPPVESVGTYAGPVRSYQYRVLPLSCEMPSQDDQCTDMDSQGTTGCRHWLRPGVPARLVVAISPEEAKASNAEARRLVPLQETFATLPDPRRWPSSAEPVPLEEAGERRATPPLRGRPGAGQDRRASMQWRRRSRRAGG